jgi:two-component system sensor histidine kinase TctE
VNVRATTGAGAAAAPSLTARVLRRVLLPLALTWLVGTAVALVVASYFTEQAFDRGMLDDAYAVSANVQAGERDIELLLSPREVNNVLFDQSRRCSSRCCGPTDRCSLARGPAGAAPEEGARYRYSRITHQGQVLRAVVLNHDAPNALSRGDCTDDARARTVLVERLLIYSLAPQFVLLALLATWLWRGIDRGFGHSATAPDAGTTRAHDLAPVPVALARTGWATRSTRCWTGSRSASAQRSSRATSHELRTRRSRGFARWRLWIGAAVAFGVARTAGKYRAEPGACDLWWTNCWRSRWPTRTHRPAARDAAAG